MTKGEIQAVLFVASSLLIGAFVLLVKQYDSDFLPDLGPAAVDGQEHSGIRPEFTATTANTMAMASVTTGGISDIENRNPLADVPVSQAVSRRAGPGYQVSGVSSTSSSSFDEPLVPVNTAPASELQKLPGIGPKLAERIINFRKQAGNFATVEQLMEVKGIGPAKLDRLRPFVELR